MWSLRVQVSFPNTFFFNGQTEVRALREQKA